jgi:hypothetical protein
MRIALAALLLLAAAPVSAGELIHFRSPDGRAGMVDHPSKLPPGAIVVERRAKTERADEPPPPAPVPGPARRDEASSRAGSAALGDPVPARRSGDAAACLRLGLPADCAAGEIGEARRWCERGESARRRVEQAEQELEQAEESLEDCETGALRGGYCSEQRLESAQFELEDAERSLSDLENACRSGDCLPGWVRAGCSP